ncbi:hypothetical protein ACFLT5_00025 [Chloroflexota bacterium]
MRHVLILVCTTFLMMVLVGCGGETTPVIEVKDVTVVVTATPTPGATRDLSAEVASAVEGTAQVAVGQTVAAWPTHTPVPSLTPSHTPTYTPQPTNTPTPTQRVYRWKDSVVDPMSKMGRVTDMVRGSTWYYHVDNPEDPESTWIGLNIAAKDDDLRLVLFIYYTAEEWLNINEYLVGADDQAFTLTPGLGEVEREGSDGRVYESYQTEVSQSQLEMIEAVIRSEVAVLRHVGDQTFKERAITMEEKNAMLVTLAVFEELGGDLYALPTDD